MASLVGNATWDEHGLSRYRKDIHHYKGFFIPKEEVHVIGSGVIMAVFKPPLLYMVDVYVQWHTPIFADIQGDVETIGMQGKIFEELFVHSDIENGVVEIK